MGMGSKKYFGKIGLSITMEVDPINRPSVWEDCIVEKPVTGEILRSTIKNESSENLNTNINISNRIRIIAEPYVLKNLEHIVYATYMGIKWRVSNVDLDAPGLILDLGGPYNEQ